MVRAFHNSRFNIQPSFLITFAFALLIIPVRWVFGWFIAVSFHEICHYIAICLFDIPVYRISISASGAKMQTGEMSAFQETFCALAGPLGSFVLLAFLHMFPYMSLCALAQSIFNLLPIYPLDGGRVTTGILALLFGCDKGIKIGKIISASFSVLLAFVCIVISIYMKFGITTFIFGILLIVRIVKIPCKERKQIVQ